jgi:hypothetical protein
MAEVESALGYGDAIFCGRRERGGERERESSYLASKLENLAAKFELGSCYVRN